MCIIWIITKKKKKERKEEKKRERKGQREEGEKGAKKKFKDTDKNEREPNRSNVVFIFNENESPNIFGKG